MCHVSLGTLYDMVLSRLVCRMVDIADNCHRVFSHYITMCHVSLGTLNDMVLSRLLCRIMGIADNVMVSVVIILQCVMFL